MLNKPYSVFAIPKPPKNPPNPCQSNPSTPHPFSPKTCTTIQQIPHPDQNLPIRDRPTHNHSRTG